MGWFSRKSQEEETVYSGPVSPEVVHLELENSAMRKKYHLVGAREKLDFSGGTPLGYRIQALIDIPEHGVVAGDLGGYVEDESVLSHEGSCWIGGDAYVSKHHEEYRYGDGSRVPREPAVRDDALVTGNAMVYGRVFGNAKISGNAYVGVDIGKDSIITDNSYIYNSSVSGTILMSGNARVTAMWISSCSKTPVTISGDISLKGKSDRSSLLCENEEKIILSGASRMHLVSIKGTLIFDAEVNLEEVTFDGDTTILGNPQIKPQTKFTGRNVISGDSFIPPGSHVHDVTMDHGILQYGAIGTAQPQDTSSLAEQSAPVLVPAVNSIDITEYMDTITQIETEYESYTTDIVKLIKYPAMVDASIPEVADFIAKLRVAKRSLKSGSAERVRDIAEALELAFIRAENKVRTLVSSHLDEGKKKSLKTAEKMFKLAIDEASPEPEKKLGFKAGMRALEGVVDVPDRAVDNLKAQIGLLELEV